MTKMSSLAEVADRCSIGWRALIHASSTRLHGPNAANRWLTWIANERIAIGTIPTAESLGRLREEGVTHVVNCRSGAETWLSQDLAVERAVFGESRVAHAPMWDTGRRQRPNRWSRAVSFACEALDEDSTAGVLIHCQQGSHRSVLVGYAVLRLRGHTPDVAARLILDHRAEGELLPAYAASVEDWIACGQPCV